MSFRLWEDPGKPVDTLLYKLPPIFRPLIHGLLSLGRTMDLKLVRQVKYTEEQIDKGQVWPSLGETMMGTKRLNNLQTCVETAIGERVPGDLIETGVWRGGACILMRAILAAHGVRDRRVFVADSFEGLPPPNEERYSQDKGDTFHKEKYLAVSQEAVEENFRKYGLLDEQVVFLKGWFKDTLPCAPITTLAVMRLDGDMYESTMDALSALYGKLAKGGFCIIDDYGAVPGCKQAVDEYRKRQGISSPLIMVDDSACYWRKPTE